MSSAQKLTSNTSLTNGAQLVKERNPSSNKVKLCGYLKKKRNKVGGWRKMWFVLQDKLLLSYTSKEEYDNKLVSFKDVLNLVPGTTVRPLGGFRFTIETTTHVMYTFHCDDRNAYREWITTLLDSLCATKFISATISSTPSISTSTLAAYSLVPLQHQRFRNTSVDNIPHALYSNVAEHSQRKRELSSSCDSMRQRIEFADRNYEYAYLERIEANAKTTTNGLTSKSHLALTPTLSLPTHGYSGSSSRSSDGGCGGGGGCCSGESGVAALARLPIARSTAKILERNGVNSSGLTKKHQQQQQYQKRQQQQVNCCNRNNGTIVNVAATDNNCNNNNSNDNVYDERFGTEASATHFRLHGESATNNNCMDEERNGYSAASSAGTGSSTISSTSSASVSRHSTNQSVLRINSMFQQQQQQQKANSCSPTSERQLHQLMTIKDLLPNPKSTQTSCDQIEIMPKRSHINNNNNNKSNSSGSNGKCLALVDFYSMTDDGNVVDDNISADYSCCTNDSTKPIFSVKDQIQRMNIKGRKETTLDAVDKRERKRIVVTKRFEEESLTESANMSNKVKSSAVVAKSKSLDNTSGITNNDTDERYSVAAGDGGVGGVNRSSEPIYAVVDLAHKYAQRQQRIVESNLKSLDSNRCRSYESIIQGVEPRIVLTNRDGSIEKSTSNLHEDDIDGIYEDGDKFVANCENNDLTNSEEDENIYEPVGFHNFASQKINTTTTQPNTFWRYITRLKVNSLLHFTRMRRNNHMEYDSLQLPTAPTTPATTLKTNQTKRTTTTTLTKKKQTRLLPPTTTTPSQFTNIKHKFGAHRKSMQTRVRKMCTTRTDEATKTMPISSNGICIVGSAGANGANMDGVVVKKSKSRWKSVKIRPKQFNSSSYGSNCSSTTSTNSTTDDNSNATTKRQRFFGSLPHLRKARVSLFSTPNLILSSAKDQNSNLSEIVDKATTTTTTTTADVGGECER